MRAVAERVPSLAPSEIENVIFGCSSPEGCQGMNTAHIAATAAGFPKEVPATPVNRFCCSGSQAVVMAAHSIIDEAT